jgi:hypothetical protein
MGKMLLKAQGIVRKVHKAAAQINSTLAKKGGDVAAHAQLWKGISAKSVSAR